MWSLFFAIRRANGPEGAWDVIARREIDAVALSSRVPSDRSIAPMLAPRMETIHASADVLVLRTSR